MNVKIDGAALEDFGFTDLIEIDGVGLLTFGNVWNCTGDWVQPNDGIATVWGPNTNPLYGDAC